jgi:hypothetical protein
MDEPQDRSIAAIKVQRNRDIRVVAGEFMDQFLSGCRACLFFARRKTEDHWECASGLWIESGISFQLFKISQEH